MIEEELLDKLAIREVLERYMRHNDDRGQPIASSSSSTTTPIADAWRLACEEVGNRWRDSGQSL